jgi:hypothetical protein
MGPTQVDAINAGAFNRATLCAIWGPAEAAAKAMNFDEAVSAIQKTAERIRP